MPTKREKDLLKKIEELEARIKLLEARPVGETHLHHHYPQQLPSPQPLTPYVYPSVTWACASSTVGLDLNNLPEGCSITPTAATYGPDH